MAVVHIHTPELLQNRLHVSRVLTTKTYPSYRSMCGSTGCRVCRVNVHTAFRGCRASFFTSVDTSIAHAAALEGPT